MIVPAEVMRRLIALEQAARDAAARRDEAVSLVLATVQAPPDAQIVVREDGAGEVIAPADNAFLSDDQKEAV